LLLVEDDPAFAKALLATLARHSVVSTWTRTVLETRELLHAVHPPWRYAIIDERLPDGSGLEVIKELRATGRCAHAALVSASRSFERVLAAFRAHEELLPKPNTPQEVHHLLTALEERDTGCLQPAPSQTRFGRFVIDVHGLHTPVGLTRLSTMSLKLLAYLGGQFPAFTSSLELAQQVFHRRDRAAADLVRKYVANTRRALGSYGWIIESVNKRGYRLDPRVLDRQLVDHVL
jgi:DNA-binding response OmpR family regulator